MSHQDWKPVVLRKSTSQLKRSEQKNVSSGNIVKRYGGGQNKQTINTSSISYDEDHVPKDKVSLTLRTQIQQARVAKGLTQKQLSTKCNLQASIIKDYEAGLAIPNSQILNKLRKVLGCKLSKK